MKKFETKIEYFRNSLHKERVRELGEEGWQIVYVQKNMLNGVTAEYQVWLQREVDDLDSKILKHLDNYMAANKKRIQALAQQTDKVSDDTADEIRYQQDEDKRRASMSHF